MSRSFEFMLFSPRFMPFSFYEPFGYESDLRHSYHFASTGLNGIRISLKLIPFCLWETEWY